MGEAKDIILFYLQVLGMALFVLFFCTVVFFVFYGTFRQNTCQKKIDINNYSCKEIRDATLNETRLMSCKVSSNIIADVYFDRDYIFKYYIMRCRSEE